MLPKNFCALGLELKLIPRSSQLDYNSFGLLSVIYALVQWKVIPFID